MDVYYYCFKNACMSFGYFSLPLLLCCLSLAMFLFCNDHFNDVSLDEVFRKHMIIDSETQA